MIDKIPKEVQEAVTLPEMRVPDFQPHVKESDLADFDKRDKKMLLFCSVLEQKADFLIRQVQELNGHARRLEAEMVVTRRKQKEINWSHGVMKWVGVTLAAGLVAAILRAMFMSLFQLTP